MYASEKKWYTSAIKHTRSHATDVCAKKKTTQHNINAYIGNVMYARVQNNACADKTLSVRENMRYTSIFKRIRSRETDVCA